MPIYTFVNEVNYQ